MQTELIFNRVTVLGKSIKIFLNRVVGPVVFVWLVYSIYQQVVQQPDLHQSLHHIGQCIWGARAWAFWLCICLVAANWGLEARKWQLILKPLQPVSFSHSLKGVLAGVAFAVNTPNRIGEYGGRMLFVPGGKRMQSISLTVIASISQLIITLLAGAVALIWMQESLKEIAETHQVPVFGLKLLNVAVIFMVVICLLFYFRMGWLLRIVQRMPLAARLLTYIEVAGEIDVRVLLRVLSLSAFRYIVFVSQYVLLLWAMHVEVPLINAFWLISVLYLILALVPTMALLEIGLRGKIGIMLFQVFSANSIGIYAATTGIWLLNLVMPALAGSIIAVGIKIFNTRK